MFFGIILKQLGFYKSIYLSQFQNFKNSWWVIPYRSFHTSQFGQLNYIEVFSLIELEFSYESILIPEILWPEWF